MAFLNSLIIAGKEKYLMEEKWEIFSDSVVCLKLFDVYNSEAECDLQKFCILFCADDR